MQRTLVAAALAFLTAVHCARAADDSASVTALDPAFAPGLAKVKQASGFIEDQPGRASTDWKPNLQLLVGFKAVENSKRTIYFVELTTLPPPPTNSPGQPWPSAFRTNEWGWPPSNKVQFVTALYPVRVRVFDETGRQLKGGQTPMAWGILTNGLMDLCRLSLETYGNKTNESSTNRSATVPSRSAQRVQSPRGKNSDRAVADPPAETATAAPHLPSDEFMLATGGGFLWMFGMFSDLQTVPTVADVWEKAQYAVRWPSMWTLVTSAISRNITIVLMPRTRDVTLISAAASGAGPLYRLPVDLKSGKRELSQIEIIVGPAHGAEMLLAGIHSIRARHPTKPKQEFLTQVLAAGTVSEVK